MQRSKGGAEVIPRTDQFIEISDTEVAIVGVATWQDQVWHLKDRLRVFLGVVGTLERDEDRNYLATDPRAGKLASVHRMWMRMVGAAQLLLATSVVRRKISPEVNGIVKCFGTSSESSRAVTDVARSICFLLSEEETRGVIPVEKIERLRAIAGHLEDLTMSDEVGRLRAVQEEFQRWVQGTPGVRAWIKSEVLPPVLKMVNEQEQLIAAKRAAVNGLEEERRRAWHEGRSLEVPDEIKAMYDRDSDPRQLSARRIGRLRDEGKHEQAQIAEAFAVLSFHDAGEAGNIDKLMPLLTEIRGLSSQFDLAYFARCDSGLERKDWEPRFDARVMRGMVERFKARFVPPSMKKQVQPKKRKPKAPKSKALTQIERDTMDCVMRHGNNIAAAAKELSRDPKTVRENYERARAKLGTELSGSRSVTAKSALPRDMRGNESIEGNIGSWSDDGEAFTMGAED